MATNVKQVVYSDDYREFIEATQGRGLGLYHFCTALDLPVYRRHHAAIGMDSPARLQLGYSVARRSAGLWPTRASDVGTGWTLTGRTDE